MKTLARSGESRSLSLFLLLGGVVLFFSNGHSVAKASAQTPEKEEIQRLQGTLREEGIEKRDPDTLAGAIERLGELKAKQAIDDLIGFLAFEKPEHIDPQRPPERPTAYSVRYPVVGALVNIGQPAVRFLMDVIAQKEGTSLRSKNALAALILIFRDDHSAAVRLLRRRSKRSTTTVAKQRLEAAAEYVANF